ncbi:helix-turn-helix domain-containing protein [Clostridium kluyveri]|uniref:Transcriptional regulator n=1 Tax=Clostridium kluyveri TaxID=1534 RepID=A0A1L5FBV4_CLOKL|nr:helix-turn-helix transcriptional regulator [Clostridium kluyveri]APM40457.1 transcriptional regulator [Clostridium kluyveri]
MGLKKSFGDKIYDLRMGLELTQEEFIARLRPPFSRTTLSYIENGISMPSAEFIKAICEAYNVSADWLLDINDTVALTIKERQLLDKYNELCEKNKQLVFNLLDALNYKIDKDKHKSSS